MSLLSLRDGFGAAVFGARGGVGGALVRALCADPRCAVVYAGARAGYAPADQKVRPFTFDLLAEQSIASAADSMIANGAVQLVVVATGILHDATMTPEKTWRALSPEVLGRAFAINAIGPALIAKHMLGRFPKNEKTVFAALSARVGSISDNRLGGWHAYRASKAALNMLVRNAAIELARSNRSSVCVTLHPGTVETPLSRPFQDGVRTGKLLTPDTSASHLLGVIDQLTPTQSGGLFAWNGQQIPF